MAGNKKLNLEWIPDAYLAKENSPPKKETMVTLQADHLIVKSTGLYRTKKIAKGPPPLRRRCKSSVA
jgi:hypothetical protein